MKDVFDRDVEVGSKVVLLFSISCDFGITKTFEAGTLFDVNTIDKDEKGGSCVGLHRNGETYLLTDPKVVKVV